MLKIGTSELDELLEQTMQKDARLADLLFNDMSEDPYGISMVDLTSLMLVFHMCKDAGYGRSWAKRGHVGVFHNVMRKVDRLDKLAKVSMLSGDSKTSATLIDTLIDLSLYCMMWTCYLAAKDPHSFNEWIETVWCKATGIQFEDVEYVLPREEN